MPEDGRLDAVRYLAPVYDGHEGVRELAPVGAAVTAYVLVARSAEPPLVAAVPPERLALLPVFAPPAFHARVGTT